MENNTENNEHSSALELTSFICKQQGIKNDDDIVAIYKWIHQMEVDCLLVKMLIDGLVYIPEFKNGEPLFQRTEKGLEYLVKGDHYGSPIWNQIEDIIREKDQE